MKKFQFALSSILLCAVLFSCKKSTDFAYLDGNWSISTGTSNYKLSSSDFRYTASGSVEFGYEIDVNNTISNNTISRTGRLKSFDDNGSLITSIDTTNLPFEFDLALNNDDFTYTLKIKDVSYSSYQTRLYNSADYNNTQYIGFALVEYITAYELYETGTFAFNSNTKGFEGGNKLVLSADSVDLNKTSRKIYSSLTGLSTYNPDSVYYLNCACITDYYVPLSTLNFEETIVAANQIYRYAFSPSIDSRYFEIEKIDKETFKITSETNSKEGNLTLEGSFEIEMKKQ